MAITDQQPTTFADLEELYGPMIEQEIDNDIKDFMWSHGITNHTIASVEDDE